MNPITIVGLKAQTKKRSEERTKKREEKGEKSKAGDDSVAGDEDEVKAQREKSNEERAKRREERERNKVDANSGDKEGTPTDDEPQKETKKRRWWEFNKKSE